MGGIAADSRVRHFSYVTGVRRVDCVKSSQGDDSRSRPECLDSLRLRVSVGCPMSWRAKGAEWLKRYGVAEVAGLCTALLGAFAARALTGSEIAAAYGGAIGENLGYYGVIVGREVVHDQRAASAAGRGYGLAGAGGTARNLAFEFGIAEVVDSTLLRPLAMGLGLRLLGGGLGIVAGKLAADLTFYVPVICAYELRRYLAHANERARARATTD